MPIVLERIDNLVNALKLAIAYADDVRKKANAIINDGNYLRDEIKAKTAELQLDSLDEFINSLDLFDQYTNGRFPHRSNRVLTFEEAHMRVNRKRALRERYRRQTKYGLHPHTENNPIDRELEMKAAEAPYVGLKQINSDTFVPPPRSKKDEEFDAEMDALIDDLNSRRMNGEMSDEEELKAFGVNLPRDSNGRRYIPEERK